MPLHVQPFEPGLQRTRLQDGQCGGEVIFYTFHYPSAGLFCSTFISLEMVGKWVAMRMRIYDINAAPTWWWWFAETRIPLASAVATQKQNQEQTRRGGVVTCRICSTSPWATSTTTTPSPGCTPTAAGGR